MSILLLDLRRALSLVRVVLNYGLAPLFAPITRLPSEHLAPGVRLRSALEELGLTYLKLGQFLAMRFDVIPGEIVRELQKLFENIPPAPFSEIRSLLEQELGGPLTDHYSWLSSESIAAASVAQVYEGCTVDGRRVAVKVQRPGVQRIFEADVRNLQRITRLIDALGLMGSLSACEMLDEFAVWTARALDFRIEGETADRLRRHALEFEHVPVVYWDLTTARVLTLELIEGLSLSQVATILETEGAEGLAARLPELDLRLVLNRLALASLHQLFEVGFFHGDPHPGNVIIRTDNTAAFVDFGIFGELTEFERRVLTRHVEAMALGNIGESVRYYAKQLIPTADTDWRAFTRQANTVFRRWYDASARPDAPILERHLGRYSGEMMELARRHHLRMALGTLLFWRAMNALDSTALRFPEYFDLLESMRSFFDRGLVGLTDRVAESAFDQTRWLDYADATRAWPEQAQRLLQALDQKQLDWPLRMEESSNDRRSENARDRAGALALTAFSLALLGTAGFVDVAFRDWTFALSAPLLVWSIFEARA